MADASDVETALAMAAAAALYPMGTSNGSVTGLVYRVYRGWPADAPLAADIANAVQHVSINAIDGTVADIPQFPANWIVPATVVPPLTVSVAGDTVIFGGSAGTGLLAGVCVNDTGFSYRTQPGDSPAAVAARLAALINQVFFATLDAATITILGAERLLARVEADQTAILPTRRQRQAFRLAGWLDTPQNRDLTMSALDSALSQIPFLTLPDGTAARLRYGRTESSDIFSVAPLYRRDIMFEIEYTTTLVQAQPSMLFGVFANDSVGTVQLN
ncbi:MAG: hypothetical protein POG24_03965 [Acidocella sp.]|nr:hypothetical protein [Acidocella sp.]